MAADPHQSRIGDIAPPRPERQMFATDEMLKRDLELLENGCLNLEVAAGSMARSARNIREQLFPGSTAG